MRVLGLSTEVAWKSKLSCLFLIFVLFLKAMPLNDHSSGRDLFHGSELENVNKISDSRPLEIESSYLGMELIGFLVCTYLNT